MITPWGMYMNPSRTGVYAFPSIVSAEPMTSKRGRASAAPRPCRQARRSNSTLLIMGRHLFRNSAMRKWVTGNDRTDESLHAVLVRGDILHQTIHHDFVITFQPPA